MYTALVLDEESRQRLVKRFAHLIPPEWEIVAHHMTVNMGPITKGPAESALLEQDAELTVISVAADEKVMAVGVSSDIPSKNTQKHITVAVNRNAGGKPFHSNKLETWEPLSDPFDLFGTIQEVG
jgi:hypothetical protein